MDWRNKINHTDEDCYQTNFDWIKRMNNAVAYIEAHLDDEIDLTEVAKAACCSVHHFKRLFSFIAEIPLTEYLRRRRLTLAAFELQKEQSKVIDAALRFGYDSPESFSRAFKAMHGVAPSAVKNSGIKLKAFPCISFHISIKGEAYMDYRIEQRDTFKMFGAVMEVSTVDSKNFALIPKFWDSCRTDGTMANIRKAAGIDDETPLHAAMYNCTDTSHTYMIGYFAQESDAHNDFTSITVPASTWAIFHTEELSITESAKQAAIMWKRIFTEWFVTSQYELGNAPELELHYNKGNGRYVTEVWIPIVKK